MASKPEPEPIAASPKWTLPSDVMKLRQLKRRIKTPGSSSSSAKASSISSVQNATSAAKTSAAKTSATGGRRRFDGVFGSQEKENDLDRGDDDEVDDEDDDDNEEDNECTPSKRQKKNPFSVSPRRKLNLGNKAASSCSKDSLLAGFEINERLTRNVKSKVNSLKSEDEQLARPIDGSHLSNANPSSRQQQHQQQQQQSFLDLISSISEESVDNTELFQKLSSQRQRSSKSTPVMVCAAAATAVAPGHAAVVFGHAASEDVNSSVVSSGNQSAPSSANSSFNLSNLNLSSAASSPSTSSVGFGISSENCEIAPDKLIVSAFLPVDWSLKTRIRLQADAPWPWQGTLKTMDEADGVAAFMRGDSLGETSSGATSSGATSSSSSSSVSSSPSWHAQIQSSTLTWIFPSIPGLPSFPRFGSNLKNVEAHPLTTQQSVVHALQQDFASAFTSVFNQLKGSRCPYFYVCTQRFTVLFRTEGLGGCEGINVQIAPTSKGLRDGLNSEGIQYVMPLSLKRRSATTSSSSSGVNHFAGIGGDSAQTFSTTSTSSASASSSNIDEDIEAEEEDLESTAASNWLESMGIDKSKFPTLNPQRVSLAADNYKVVDGRPQSLVTIQGLGDVQAFFNFLLNNDHLTTSSSGSQAGLPPTILSPVSYKGASLRQLRYTHGTMRYKSTRASQILHTLDVVGPILPHHLLNIAAIASNTPVHSFNISCTNQESTFTFNHRRANNTSAGTGNTEGAESQISNSHSSSSSSSSKLSPEVETILSKTGLRKEAVAEMGMNRIKDKSGIRESYYEEDNAFTSVLQ